MTSAREELREGIKALGLSQAQFAEAMHVQPRTVRKWLNGESPVPHYALIGFDHLRTLHAVLKVQAERKQ